MSLINPGKRRVLSRGSYREARRIGEILRKETTGGLLLMVATILALFWANSPQADSYFAIRDLVIGVGPLRLTLGQWASDGLLAVFFFLVGLELKREFVSGDLRDPAKALVPVAAAFGGVIVPALLYALVNLNHPDTLRGWAIPTATDIAFAVAVLAIIGSHLPSALRIFLLTLAVVDDLIAIFIIAAVYTTDLRWLPLAGFLLPLSAFAYLAQRHRRFFATRVWAPWLILLPLGAVSWALMHASGIHATISGVLLGFAIPVIRSDGGPGSGLAEIFEHRYRPLSAGFAVPVFAFFAAGVNVGGLEGLSESLGSPVTMGILVGLVFGKPIGIVATTWALTRFTRAELDEDVAWIDLVGVGILAGIGFTVSLLIGELSFGLGSVEKSHAKVGILLASLSATLLASVVLVARNHHYLAVQRREQVDANADGIPDVYQTGNTET